MLGLILLPLGAHSVSLLVAVKKMSGAISSLFFQEKLSQFLGAECTGVHTCRFEFGRALNKKIQFPLTS
jgi:hypothetical protein